MKLNLKNYSLPLAALAGFALTAAPAQAAAVFAQVNSPGVPTTDGGSGEQQYFFDVSNSDLLQGIVGVESGSWGAPGSRLNDGVHGASFDQGGGTTGIAWPTISAAVTFNLGTGANGLGYDITSVQSIAAWQSAAFGNQGYTLAVQPVGGSFTTLTTVIYEPFSGNEAGASRVIITDDGAGSGGNLATGIEAIRFTADSIPSSTSNRATYRELDVFGTDTVAVPEPSSLVLLGLGGLALLRRRRRD